MSQRCTVLDTLNYLSESRLGLIPLQYRAQHEYCFYAHDQMLALLREYSQIGPHLGVQQILAEKLKARGAYPERADLLTLLQASGHKTAYRHLVISHLVLGLTSDMLNFLYEGLICLEKRKIVVALSLIRKPLKDHMLFLSHILGDEEEFLQKFESQPCQTLNGQTPAIRAEIFKKALEALPDIGYFSVEALENFVFSKTCEEGFEPYWQRALHLVTSQGTLLKTEELNLNWVFHDPSNDALYDIVYPKLAYLMLYVLQVTVACFERIANGLAASSAHLHLVSQGLAECVMPALNEGRAPLTAALNGTLKQMLVCPFCSTQLALAADTAPQVYLHEVLTCSQCARPIPIPLYFLLTRGADSFPNPQKRPSLFAQLVEEALADPAVGGG